MQQAPEKTTGMLPAAMRKARLRSNFLRSGIKLKPVTPVFRTTALMPGLFERAQLLKDGKITFAGHQVELGDTPLWRLAPQNPRFDTALSTFQWLDDLAADGKRVARKLAGQWVLEWLDRFGGGDTRHWQPDLVGKRLSRLISHLDMIESELDSPARDKLRKMLARSMYFLSHGRSLTDEGLPRFETHAGYVMGCLVFEEFRPNLAAAVQALGAECSYIDAKGGIPTRNPDELLQIFCLLVWCLRGLEMAEQVADLRILDAMERIAPVLRSLRLGDGTLVPMQGGGGSRMQGILDYALSESGVRAKGRLEHAMGFARLHAGRTSVFMDSAPPPAGTHSANGQGSGLGIIMGSGPRQIITSCGSGMSFGWRWHNACRDSDAHSTLTVNGSSAISISRDKRSYDEITARCNPMDTERLEEAEGVWFAARHDAFLPDYGLLHQRRLYLSPDGRDFRGEDTLMPSRQRMKAARFNKALKRGYLPVHIRFHLHPDVQAEQIGHSIDLSLPSGETWRFEYSGAKVYLDDSIYLDEPYLEARKTRQIILYAEISEPELQVNWALGRIDTNPKNTRDLVAKPLYDPSAKPVPAPQI